MRFFKATAMTTLALAAGCLMESDARAESLGFWGTGPAGYSSTVVVPYGWYGGPYGNPFPSASFPAGVDLAGFGAFEGYGFGGVNPGCISGGVLPVPVGNPTVPGAPFPSSPFYGNGGLYPVYSFPGTAGPYLSNPALGSPVDYSPVDTPLETQPARPAFAPVFDVSPTRPLNSQPAITVPSWKPALESPFYP